MAEITAALVKDLREKTGAGMMDCKKALAEAGGDMEAAVDWLRKKGLSAAAKKSGRVAAEGLIGVASAPAPPPWSRSMPRPTSSPATRLPGLRRGGGGDGADRRRGHRGDQGRAVPRHRPARSAEQLTQLVATIGENMTIRRASVLRVSKAPSPPISIPR